VAAVIDEETFVLPDDWRTRVIPRRGGRPGPALSADAAPGDELVLAAKATIQARLAEPTSDPDLVAAAEAYLSDPATGPAVGAGVVAGLVACHVGITQQHQLPKIADAWVATRGVVFAAQAAAHAAELEFGGPRTEPHVARRAGGVLAYFPHWVALASRVRAHLAVAPDDVYASAITALERLRPQSPDLGPATSFLLPTQRSWVDADCVIAAGGRSRNDGLVLWCAASTSEQLGLVAPLLDWSSLSREPTALPTAADGVGPAIAAHLLTWFDSATLYADAKQRILGVVAQLPTDDALAGLIARLDRKDVPQAVLDAAGRFPRRALRLLAAGTGRATGDLLRVHVLANRELAAVESAALPPAAGARVEAILTELTVPVAPLEALPSVLVTPPWTIKRPAVKPVVVSGLTFADEAVLVWAPGEQDAWAARWAPQAAWWHLDTSIETAIERYRSRELPAHHQVTLMVTGPSELIEPLLPHWRPARSWDADRWLPAIIARHGLAALPATMILAAERPATHTRFLLPYANAAIAAHMADVYTRVKAARPVAVAWFERHAAYAARALTPLALGKPGKARQAAEQSLRALAVQHRAEILAAGAGYGPEALAGIEALLDTDPLQLLPTRIPALPAWADPSLLPRILLADRSSALGDREVQHLCTMLAISKPGEPYAGVPLVRDLCDRSSLAEFAWALFSRWQAAGAPAKEAWPLQALRWIGDDETVRRLSPVIRAWPGEGGHAKALTGLDVLAELGTDLALIHLHSIAQKAKFKGLKDRAAEKVADVASGLGLTADQLADRLVPDLGLDANGSLTLDYGPRRFVVGFDEQLKPYVVDEAGTRRKDLPKPGARDDAQLAPAAYRRFSGLKKDVRTIAADQIHRLETAMVDQRQWSAADFRDYFVRHPLQWHIVRRLVWTATVGDGDSAAFPVTFRVAEDRTFADVDDNSHDLPAEAHVGLAHPVRLGDQLAAWSQIFGDYEILQPFAQLGRSTYELTEPERQSVELARFVDLKVPTTTVLGLERRGWQRGAPQDGGVQVWLWWATPDDRAVVVDLDPGIPIGAVDAFPEQRIASVWVNNGACGTWRPRQLTTTFGTLDAVAASEVLRDLTEVLTR
jgi:hypothetical protein